MYKTVLSAWGFIAIVFPPVLVYNAHGIVCYRKKIHHFYAP
jgi:hypothetical protein